MSPTAAAKLDELIDELENQMSLVFSHARTVWKDAAAAVHPELPSGAYKLLVFVAHAPRSNAHQLAQVFEIDKSAVSRQVRLLEELGLVESQPDPHDARFRALTATPAALTQLRAVRLRHEARLRRALGHLDESQLAACVNVFKQLAKM
jgi:DNA-binding MarR family transcriptional regulator